jgi:hypothetical protein
MNSRETQGEGAGLDVISSDTHGRGTIVHFVNPRVLLD